MLDGKKLFEVNYEAHSVMPPYELVNGSCYVIAKTKQEAIKKAKLNKKEIVSVNDAWELEVIE